MIENTPYIHRQKEKNDGGPMCLPGFSHYHYTSHESHLGLVLAIICSGSLLISAMLILAMSPLMTDGNDEKERLVENIALGLTAAAIPGAIGAGLFFVCGTRKKNRPVQEEEQLSPKFE